MRFFQGYDLRIVAPTFLLLALSLIVLSSMSMSLFTNQLILSTLGILAFLLFSSMNIVYLKNFKVFFYVVSLLVLTLLLFFGIEARGAQRWIEIFGIRMQFSELLKPFLTIAFASQLTLWSGKLTITRLFLCVVLFVSIAFLLFRQPDLGNTIVYSATFLFMLFAAGMNVWYLFFGFVFFAISLPIIWERLAQYQKDRITTFINPSYDPLGIGYNAIQSAIAVGSGLFFGRGLGRGVQSQLAFLPERHTDFIFATFSEEFGFLGSFVVLSLYFLLLLRILTIAREAEDTFSGLVVLGVFALMLIQVFINIGMNLRLIPITGVTLPLFSYGGSSLIATMISLGIVNSIQKATRKREEILEIR